LKVVWKVFELAGEENFHGLKLAKFDEEKE
jgi:hypothetical protein